MSKQHHDIVAILVFALALAWWSPAYSDGHNNHIRIKGSDTLSVVAKEWGRIYSEQHSPLTIESSGGGSGNGIAALNEDPLSTIEIFAILSITLYLKVEAGGLMGFSGSIKAVTGSKD